MLMALKNPEIGVARNLTTMNQTSIYQLVLIIVIFQIIKHVCDIEDFV